MPLYLARGPATVAFLVRAQDPSEVLYVIDTVCDPGGFQVELYEGPLNLVIDVPASINTAPDYSQEQPDLQLSYDGSRDLYDVVEQPRITAVDEMEEDLAHLRRLAFPAFMSAVEQFAREVDDEDEPFEVPSEVLIDAITADIVTEGHRAYRQRELPGDDEAERRSQAGISISFDRWLKGGSARARSESTGWSADAEEAEEDDATEAAVSEAVARYGSVSLVASADGTRWTVGSPVVGEGATLREAMLDGAT